MENHQHQTNTLFKRAAYAFSGAFIGKVSAALAGIIIARSLGVTLFGTYSAVWELVLLCASITETGLTVGIQRDGAGDKKRLPELVGNALFIRIVIGIATLIVAYFLSSKISQNPNAPFIFLFLSVASIVVIVSEPLFAGLLALGQQRIVAAFDSVRGILMLAGVVVVMFFKGGVIAIALLQAVLYFITFLVLIWIVYKHYSLKVNFSTMWNAQKTSFVYGVSGQLFAIYSRIPIVLLAYFTNDKQVGYFTAAMRVVAIIQVVGAGIYSRAFLPSLFESVKLSKERFSITSGFMFSYFTLLGALSGICLFVLAEPIILLLMGREFYESIFILRILAIALFLIFTLLAPDAAMTASNKNVYKIIFQIVGPVVGILIGPFLVIKYQAAGAAYTQNVIMLTLLILFLTYSLKRSYVNLETLWKLKFPIIGIGACGAVSLLIFNHEIIPLTIVFSCSSAVVLLLWVKSNKSFLSLKPVNKI